MQGSSPTECGVMVRDEQQQCCPVTRVPYGDVPLDQPYTFLLQGRFTGSGITCEVLRLSPQAGTTILDALALAYVVGLGLPQSDDVRFLSYTCVSNGPGPQYDNLLNAVGTVNLRGLDPRVIYRQSASILNATASRYALSITGAVPYTPPSPPPYYAAPPGYYGSGPPGYGYGGYGAEPPAYGGY
eukprot:XP_001698757.1 predicted protein [Chlamydomonas reinhardtii]